MSKVAVVGGGAAGMFASIFAAKNGNEVHLFEKNEKLGKKIFITGKGRCNVTNAADIETLLANVRANPKFLYSAFYGCSNDMVMDFFEKEGCRLKVERGDRVFPLSDHSSDIIATLERAMKREGVKIHLRHEVKSLDELEGFDSIIVATGGMSYQATGSTGDGYRFAKELDICLPEGKAVSFGQSLYWAPVDMPELRGLKVERAGLELGTVKKNRFEPAHALALWLVDCAATVSYPADSQQIDTYLRGNVLPCGEKGWCLVKVDGYSIGWGKGDGTQLKNHYPKALRKLG
jgi:predicted Rossmann fold flavoprotein